jgi:hypothetical protein
MRVALAVLLLLAAGLGAYASHAIVDEGGFADRAEVAFERPAVRDEIAGRLRSREARLTVDDPGFAAVFHDGARRMHAALFDDPDEVVSLRLAGAPSLLTLGGGGTLERELRGAAPVAADIAAWWPAALVLALLAAGGIRRTGLSLAIAGGVVVLATVVVELALLRTFTSPHGDAVVDAIWDSYLADLRLFALAAAAAGLAVSWRWRRAPASPRRAAASAPAGSSTRSPRSAARPRRTPSP